VRLFSKDVHHYRAVQHDPISFIRKALVHLFDKLANGSMTEGRTLSNKIIDLHKKRYMIEEALIIC